MKKIFFNDRFIALCSNSEISDCDAESEICELKSVRDIPFLLRKFLCAGNNGSTYIICKAETEAFIAFCDLFEIIFAGGGLVRNTNGDVLLIYRYGHWDLPKGKREKGENIAETAVREVKEECGIENIKTGDFITETYHCYTLPGGRLAMKRNVWYQMFCDSVVPVPQADEYIEKAEFVQLNKLPEYFNLMYASIREVFFTANLLK